MKKKKLLVTAIAICGLATITYAQTVPSYVPTNGLVGWWPFNGNANDESGNGNNLANNGGSYIADRNGITNSACEITNVGTNLSMSNVNPAFSTNSQSISYWFKLPSPYSYSTLTLISNGIQYNNGFLLFIDQNDGAYGVNNYAIGYMIGNGQAITFISNQSELSIWNNLISTFDGSSVNIYFNNILKGTLNYNGNINPPNNDLILANWGNPSIPNNTLRNIDDIGIWNRALTRCEIQDLYSSQLNSTFVNAGTDQTICAGDPVTLSAINSLNYSWDNGVLNGVAFNPTSTQDFTVSADSAGCLSTDVVTITVNENTTATQTQTALDSYTWPINSQTYTQSGTYVTVIPNAAGCDSTITLNLSLDFTGINEFSKDNLFTVFPNPAQSAINIKADNKLIGNVYTIYDNTGKVVLTGKLNSKDTTIELYNLSGGIYMFSVGENMQQTIKLIKE